MAKKERYPDGYYRPSIGAAAGCEDSGSSGRTDAELTASEGSIAPVRKCINLNPDRYDVPVEVHHLSKMSLAEKKGLVRRLQAELGQIRTFQKKIESSRTNGMMSSDILSFSNGPRLHSAPLKSSKGNPGVQKGSTSNRAPSGQSESAHQVSTQGSSMRMAMKQCETLLERLMAHNFAYVFNVPVDVVKLNIPDYCTIIKHPMDLGTVKQKLASGAYNNPHEFAADVRLTFTNAVTYNPPKNDVHTMAKTLSKFFEVRWKTIAKKIPAVDAHPLPEKLVAGPDGGASGFVPPAKKRKVHSVRQVVATQPVQITMTAEEKHCLSRELESLLAELPENILNFLKEHCSNGAEAGEDEIEIDLDVLCDRILFELRKLLDEYLQEKQRNNNKMAEPCEIELLHGSGISNSSMQAGKGNDPADEDIDIGGSEPPVSSYPPVEIDKDQGHRSDPGSESSSSSESESEDGDDPFNMLREGVSSDEALNKKACVANSQEDGEPAGRVDQSEQKFEPNLFPTDAERHQDVSVEGAGNERQISPDKLYRAALLKSRFADTILKAREKTLGQEDKGDLEKLRREREELEVQKRKEKARLQAEAKAAEEARRRAEAEAVAEAAAEARRRREQEREAARQALIRMEKTVDINESSRILEDLEMLRTGPGEHLPSSVGETSPDPSQDVMGGFRFVGSNPLEQLGLFMKDDEDDEDADPPSLPNGVDEAEEGEVD